MADGDKRTTTRASKKPSSKSASKKPTSKAPSKKTASRSSSSSRGAPRAEAPPRQSPGRIASQAAQQLLELTGRATEGIIGLEKNDDGWRVQVEVLEVSRIPNTTDVLALYEIDADDQGNLEGYRRIRRYVRGAADDG